LFVYFVLVADPSSPRGVLSLLGEGEISLAAGKRAQPTKEYQGSTYYGDSGGSTSVNGTAQAMAVAEDTHCYSSSGTHNVTVEAVSAFGTGAVWEQLVSTDTCAGASLRAPLAYVLHWLLMA
jgi:hypothetical protein